MVPARRHSQRGGRPPFKKARPSEQTLSDRLIRHESRRALSAQVSLASPLLRKNPRVPNHDLARALGVSLEVVKTVRHAFRAKTEIQIDRILERFKNGQSVRVDDIMRDLAVDRETAEWLGRKTADRIITMERLSKKKK